MASPGEGASLGSLHFAAAQPPDEPLSKRARHDSHEKGAGKRVEEQPTSEGEGHGLLTHTCPGEIAVESVPTAAMGTRANGVLTPVRAMPIH